MQDRTPGPLQEDQESAWIRAAQTGDRTAFDALLERYGRMVLRFLDGLCPTHADAEDLAQDVLFLAFQKMAAFRLGTNFRAWLLTIAYHEWVHGKRKKKRVRAMDPEALETVQAPPERLPEDARDELAEALRSSLTELPEEQRIVVLLRFGEGLSHAEIAELTTTDPATVRWRLFKARQTLQRVLKSWAPRERNADS